MDGGLRGVSYSPPKPDDESGRWTEGRKSPFVRAPVDGQDIRSHSPLSLFAVALGYIRAEMKARARDGCDLRGLFSRGIRSPWPWPEFGLREELAVG